MTENAKQEYRKWLTITGNQKGLPSFTQWLTGTYDQAMDFWFTSKHARSSKLARPPMLMGIAKSNEKAAPSSDSDSE